MKYYLLVLSALFSLQTFSRSPAVLPVVEIAPEQEIQKDMKQAKGRTFLEQKTLQAKKEKTHQNTAVDGLLFFLTLLLPGTIAWIIMNKAYKIPHEPQNVIPLNTEEKSEDISKAS